MTTDDLLTPRIRGGIGADEKYWDYLATGEFRLPRCSGCGRWMWPAHWRCGECGSWDLDWEAVEPVGTIYAWTRTWYSFDRVRERADQVPYVVALTEIPAAGNTRVLGVLTGPEDRLDIGAPVTGLIRPASPQAKGYATICWQLNDAEESNVSL